MEFIVAGLVLGCVYALAAGGLALTFGSTGVLNFAFGSEAYFIARFYYFLHTQHGWPTSVAGPAAILGGGPALGLALYFVLFRHLAQATTLVKVVATIGLSVSLPPLAVLCFGNPAIASAPGLAGTSLSVYHVFGVAISPDQVIVIASLIVLSGCGAAILRKTSFGLATRAVVDSPALTSLTGTNPRRIAAAIWVATAFLAGLTGVLVAPSIGLSSPDNFTQLSASAFAALIAASLRYVGRAVAAGVALGLISGFLELVVPSQSVWSSAAISATPFVFTIVCVALFALTGRTRASTVSGGPLDAAIAYEGSTRLRQRRAPGIAVTAPGTSTRQVSPATRQLSLPRLSMWSPGTLLALGGSAVLPLALHGVWTGFVGLGFGYAIVLLSYTAVTGEAGLISLCQITFAGVGGIMTAQLATNAHWPPLLALFAAGLCAVPLGAALGLISTLLGDLYFALVTLTFGVLMDNIVFNLNVFSNYGAGVQVSRPAFAASDAGFAYLALAIFAFFSLVLANLRYSTTGWGIRSVRSSQDAACSLGIGALRLKVGVTSLGACMAGVGGGVIVLYDLNASPLSFSTFQGLVWLAVVVTVGVRANIGALVAGLALSLVPAAFSFYLPLSVAQVPIALFGLGAILVTRNPDGTVAMHARQIEWSIRHLWAFGRRVRRRAATSAGADPERDALRASERGLPREDARVRSGGK